MLHEIGYMSKHERFKTFSRILTLLLNTCLDHLDPTRVG